MVLSESTLVFREDAMWQGLEGGSFLSDSADCKRVCVCVCMHTGLARRNMIINRIHC